ncbi:MAG: NAD(P)H-dependent flavin oxidoreductase, partial [Neobacillus sp.]
GTRFIVATESMAHDDYRKMLVEATQEDIILTDAFSGVKANMLKPSIINAGLDPDQLVKKDKVDFDQMQRGARTKAWRDIWSAGHGVGAIDRIETTDEIVARLEIEYREALQSINSKADKLNLLKVN